MTEFTFTGQGSLELFGRNWEAPSAKAVLLIIHGFGEHGGRYSDFAEFLLSRGISVVSFDNRGHGRSGGKRGRILDWGEYREDTKAAIAEATTRYPTAPLFLLGHSIGGTIGLDYLLSADTLPRGAIISAPALGAPGISPFKLVLSRILSGVLPGLPVKAGLDTADLSRDPETAVKYSSDPLIHGIGTPRLSTELTAAQKRVFERAPDLRCPLLLTYGGNDRIAPHEPIERFYDEAGGEDKVLQVFPDAYHELLNDIIKNDVYNLYAEWILARI